LRKATQFSQDSSNAPNTQDITKPHPAPIFPHPHLSAEQLCPAGQLWNPHALRNPSGFHCVSTTSAFEQLGRSNGQAKMLHRAQGRSRTRWISLDEQIQRMSRAPDFSSTMQAPIYSTPCRIYSNPLTLNCCLI
jgi:hypothetical protein